MNKFFVVDLNQNNISAHLTEIDAIIKATISTIQGTLVSVDNINESGYPRLLHSSSEIVKMVDDHCIHAGYDLRKPSQGQLCLINDDNGNELEAKYSKYLTTNGTFFHDKKMFTYRDWGYSLKDKERLNEKFWRYATSGGKL